MYINNEIGAMQDISQIGEELKTQERYFSCGCGQAFGKVHIYPKREGNDLLTIAVQDP